MPVRIDHVVVNVLTDMDRAVARFGGLGFAPTARGYHSLGSINHTMMFERDYLELVGIEVGATKVREEVAQSPTGLNGLVFATDDAEALYRRLLAQGIPALEPVDFSRPVAIDGVERIAAFTTVRIAPSYMPGGRIYYCEHKTPELLWHRPWLRHPNTAQGIAEFVVAVPDASQEARRYEPLLDGARFVPAGDGEFDVRLDGMRLVLMSPERYRARYGSAGCSRVESLRGQGGMCMGGLGIRVSSLAPLRQLLAQDLRDGQAFERDGRILVPASRLWDCPMEFHDAPEHGAG